MTGYDNINTLVSSAARPDSVLRVLGRFCRPKSTTGSSIMVLSICLAIIPPPILTDDISRIIILISSISLWTIFSHGINQIYDLEVDKVNKPHFPLPSGVLSVAQAWVISIGTGLGAILLGFCVLPTSTNIVFSLGMVLVSIVYSVPWFGVRKSAWIPKLMGVFVRGALWPLVSYIGACQIAGGATDHSEYLGFILSFAILFCIGMNTFEDIPDIEGDRRYGYASIAQELGPINTSYICFGAFFLAYTFLIFLQFLSPHLFRISLGILVSATLLSLFCFRFSRLLEKLRTDIDTAKPFYRFLWQLYCIQYLLLPILFRHP